MRNAVQTKINEINLKISNLESLLMDESAGNENLRRQHNDELWEQINRLEWDANRLERENPITSGVIILKP